MIIAINGYSGSGKDLVGKICLWLLSKSSLSFELWEKEEIRWWNFGEWEIKKFANAVNDCYEIITGVYFLGLDREKKEFHRDKFRDFANKTKEVFGEDVWVNALMNNYIQRFLEKSGHDTFGAYRCGCVKCNSKFNSNNKHQTLCENCYNPIFPNWIITDLRFPNEAKAIKDRGGILIRVERPELLNNQNNINLKHISEKSLDNYNFDYYICNDNSIESLIEQVKNIIIKEKII